MDHRSAHVIIIGAGMAGIRAAADLSAADIRVTLIDARDRIGGRIFTDTSLGFPLEFGAHWIHNIDQNPLYALTEKLSIDTHPFPHHRMALFGAKSNQIESDILGNQIAILNKCIDAAKEQLAHQPESPDLGLDQAILMALNNVDLNASEDVVVPHRFGSLRPAILRFLLNGYFAIDNGIELRMLSTKWFNEDEDYDGIDHDLPNGYDAILKEILAQLPNCSHLEVLLDSVVKQIDYETDRSCAHVRLDNGRVFSADHVLVTVPLGVLQNESIQFQPPLSIEKKRAISDLGMGNYCKIILIFDECFWDPNVGHIGIISEPGTQGDSVLHFPLFVSLWPSLGKPILMAPSIGSQATRVEKMPRAQLLESVMSQLRIAYPDAPSPTQMRKTRWGSDPFTLGAYSFVPVGASNESRKILAQPIASSVFFAGEATNHLRPSTVHGALESGAREAQRILSVILKESCCR